MEKPGMDRGIGLDRVNVSSLIELVERKEQGSVWTLHKFRDPDRRVYLLARRGLALELLTRQFYDRLYAKEVFRGNCLLNEGINELWTILCSAGGTKFDSGNAYLGVGDSNTAADPTQTGLQATTNKLYKAMDSGYPTYGSAQKATWRSTFGDSEANFAWNEFTVANGGSDSAKNLNRKVESKGTKSSGTWILTLDISLS